MIYDLTVGQPFHVLEKYDVGLLWLMIKKGSLFLLITIRKVKKIAKHADFPLEHIKEIDMGLLTFRIGSHAFN